MKKRSPFSLILILGSLTALSPFAIDMYLPAFPRIATDFGTEVARVALSLSSYFIGLAAGQVIYGPLLDRYGRRRPLIAGLALFVLASIGCLVADDIESLIALRFLQALGGCVAQVGAVAMVRDFFPVEQSSKIFSFLMLILGLSPLLAPTVGGFVTTTWGWHWVFILLGLIALILLAVTVFLLPEGHEPDPTVSLRPRAIFNGFLEILRDPQFFTYALSGALAFAGLFAYVAGSPIIFMNVFALTASQYGAVFAVLSVGFIGASQVNVALLRWFRSEVIYQWTLVAQAAVGVIFAVGAWNDWYGLEATVAFLFLFLACVGFTNPNAGALALAPFSRNVGSASALLGFLQIGFGALASAAVGVLKTERAFPVVAILAGSAVLGLAAFLAGRRRLVKPVAAADGAIAPVH